MHDEHEIISRRARRAHAEKQKRRARLPGLPFFLALGILTVIAWILPLRPTVSAKEKRTLETFPEFSLSAVTDGSYFSDISLWFSDTFPGRDGWIMAAQRLESLYGDSSVTVYGNASAGDKIPVPSTPAPETSADPAKPTSEPMPTPEPTPTPEPEWGGENPDDELVTLGAVIQIGDSAYTYTAFSQYYSDTYAANVPRL